MTRQKLAIVSPAPPVQNGIADYASELAPALARHFDLFWIIDDSSRDPNLPAGISVVRLREVDNVAALDDARFVYHVGNNPDHAYMLDLMAARPGLCVLHDFALNYLAEITAFPLGGHDAYANWAQRSGGAAGTIVASNLIQHGWKSRAMNKFLPMNAPVLERSQAILVHSRYAQAKAAGVASGVPVHYVPHHVSPLVEVYSKISRKEARLRLGLPEDAVLITALGFVSGAKMIGSILASLGRIGHQLPDFRFVIAGQRRPHEYDVDKDIRASGIAENVITTDFLDEEAFFLHLAATDLVSNLRYPSGGESSGTLARALGMGRPCLVVDDGPIGELPDDVAFKLPVEEIKFPGPVLGDRLDELLLTVCNDVLLREETGARAARYAATELAVGTSADRYRQLVESLPLAVTPRNPSPVAIDGRWLARDPSARAQAESWADEDRWWRLGAVPRAAKARGKLLVISDDPATVRILKDVYGWDDERLVTAGLDWIDTLPDEGVDFALIIAPWRRLMTDGDLRIAVARRLRIGSGLSIEAIGAPPSTTAWTLGHWLEWMGCSVPTDLSDVYAYSNRSVARQKPSEPREVWIGVRSSRTVVVEHRLAGASFSRITSASALNDGQPKPEAKEIIP